MSQQRIHVKTGLMFGSLMTMVVMIIAAIALEADGRIDMDTRTTLILSAGGFALFGIFTAPLRVSRHRWTLRPDGVEVRRSAWLLPPGWYPGKVIPYTDITAMDRLYHNAREGTRLTLRDGGWVWLQVPVGGDLSQALRARVGAARSTALLPGEAAGFWASWAGLLVLAMSFVLSLFVAYSAASMLWGGEFSRSTASNKGAGAMMLLPFGVVFALRAALMRRREVRRKRQ